MRDAYGDQRDSYNMCRTCRTNGVPHGLLRKMESVAKTRHPAFDLAIKTAEGSCGMHISVQHGCDFVSLAVNSSDTVASVKQKLTREQGFLFDNLVVAKRRNLEVKLEDNYTLRAYGIDSRGWLLQCEFVLTILKLNGETFSVDVKPSDVIDTVKLIIQNKEGIPVPQQCLIFDGEELTGFLTLVCYGIQRGSVVTLVSVPDADGALSLWPPCPIRTMLALRWQLQNAASSC